ncbi:MAG: EAL domain-containing protein [Gammaproteobacteria bacterium]|jgi:diguanylate cyclase (GGDEF)-like protein/PAS domain S-box-containing protein
MSTALEAGGPVDADPQAAVFDSRLQAEQLELVYIQAPASLLAAFGVAALVTLALLNVAETTPLLLWAGAQLIQTAARLVLVYLYRRTAAADRNTSRWGGLFFAGTLASGIVWGCAGFFLDFSQPVEIQLLITMSLAGVLAGAIPAYAAVLPVYIAFMVPAILIPAQIMLSRTDTANSELGLLCVVFAAALLVIARNYNKSILNTLQLSQENGDLLREMEATNASLQAEVTTRLQAERQLLQERQLFTEGPVTVFRWSAVEGWPIEYVSETVSQFGHNAKKLMGERTPYAAIIHPNDLHRVREAQMVTGEHGTRFRAIDYRIMRPDGQSAWIFDYSVPIRDEYGEVTHYAGYIMDVSERKQTEFALQQEMERAQVTLGSIADAVITTDVNGQIEYLNPMAEQLVGWEAAIARGLPVARVFALFDRHSRAVIDEPIRQCLNTGDIVKTCQDSILRRHDGERLAIQYTAAPIKSEAGEPLGVILVVHDVTAARSMERKLSYQETHDALTGLINRHEFERCLGYALDSARKARERHVLCSMDLDKLMIVNDTCSHEAGDEVLRKVTELMRECLRESDILARTGGDEFGILLKNCSLDHASGMLEDMLSRIQALRFQALGNNFETGASIGIAPLTAECESVASVMSAADIACYTAKDLGGNRLHVYQTSDQDLVRRHDEIQWVSRLSNAIKSDRLVLYYQDIAAVKPAETGGRHFEVLVRMLDEDGNIVTPDRFLPAAERYNLITNLDRWVVSHSFSWCAEYCSVMGDSGLDTMAINLSGASLTEPRFLEFVRSELEKNGVQPAHICFEITETAAVANLDAAREFIRELRQMGCRFALDDFGSGLSSFTYLKNLPVDYLKIDGSFVKDMESDAIDFAMVSSIHQLASVVGIRTIAEFVENDAVLEKLAQIGVDYAQGYGISMPAPLADLKPEAWRTA